MHLANTCSCHELTARESWCRLGGPNSVFAQGPIPGSGFVQYDLCIVLCPLRALHAWHLYDDGSALCNDLNRTCYSRLSIAFDGRFQPDASSRGSLGIPWNDPRRFISPQLFADRAGTAHDRSFKPPSRPRAGGQRGESREKKNWPKMQHLTHEAPRSVWSRKLVGFSYFPVISKSPFFPKDH